MVGFGRFWSVLFGFWSVLSAWSVPAGILGRFGRVMVGSVILVGSDLCFCLILQYDLPKYNTGEIPGIGHLKTLMDPVREYFPVKVTMKSKIEALEVIRQSLDPEIEMPIFKESAFGHFISMSENMTYCGVLTHYLLLRQIETRKRHELWFKVNGTATRFGMREFALITGLNCGESPEPDVILKASKSRRLLEHFNSPVVLVADLRKLLTGDKIKGSDKAKIAIIYFLAQVLLSGDEKKTVSLDWLSYVDDLEFFNSYPWGRVSFECTLRALKKNLRDKYQKWVRKGRNKSVKETYSICGFPWAFQVCYTVMLITFHAL